MAAHVTTVSGEVFRLTEGSQLVFGRGPEVDVAISAGRGLSRRAGVIAATAEGAWIANISRTHALYVAGDGYRIRLPRVESDAEPAGGWLVHAGTATVGSRAMLDDGLQLAVTVPGRHGRPGAAGPLDPGQAARDGDGTLLPIYLDPMTKLFLVALMWCRPWLLDPGATSPLPRTPEIARAALEATGAYHELERFDTDPEFRDRLSARVAEHLKVLRRKIAARGLAGPDVRLSDEVAVRVLIEHGVVAASDLRLLADPAWCSRQEDLWWTTELRRESYGADGGGPGEPPRREYAAESRRPASLRITRGRHQRTSRGLLAAVLTGVFLFFTVRSWQTSTGRWWEPGSGVDVTGPRVGVTGTGSTGIPGPHRVFTPCLGGVGPYRARCDAVAAAGYEGSRLPESRRSKS